MFLIRLKALDPKLNAQFERVERYPRFSFEPEVDANVCAATTQQCGCSLTSILALQSLGEPGAQAWRQMMNRTEVKENDFRVSIENRYNRVGMCSNLPKYVEFLGAIEATERSVIETGG